MKNFSCEFSVEKMAHILGVSRSGYYAFIKRPLSKRSFNNNVLGEKIRRIFEQSFETYGSPRIHAALKEEGLFCSRKRVARLMHHQGLVAKMTKKFKMQTTIQDKQTPYRAPDLINQDFTANSPNEAWVSDISYIPTQSGFVYLSIVLDLFSRKIVGLAIENHMTADLVKKAILQALTHRNFPAGVIHHSDRGSQYTSSIMQDIALYYGVQLSMGRVGNAYDNAVAESFFHTLKTELVNFQRYQNLEEAKISIFYYVHGFYNQRRKHSTLAYLSPVQFERNFEVNKNS